MKNRAPLALSVAGILLIVVGFIYDVIFAGIPYQDPTPAMTASYERHALVASVIRYTGLAALVVGIISALVRRRAK